VSAETLLAHAAGIDGDAEAAEGDVDTEIAIRNDPRLTPSQKEALLSVYRSFLADTPSRNEHS
jgi:hypothetical protein